MTVRYGSPAARWVLAATVLGSGIAFLDATVVNVALPAIQSDFGMGLDGLQWTLDAYLVTLTSLLLLGGSLGDLHGRKRIYVVGLVGFTIASVLCGIAPSTGALIAARAGQGVAAAMLVPGSLAIISATFHSDDRARAIGRWSGLAGASTALGPVLGGWMIDAVSWRLIFLINVPLAAVAVWITLRHVPETRDESSSHAPDIEGSIAISIGLGGLCYGLIESLEPVALAAGIAGVAAFVIIEARRRQPMLPLSLFRSRQFTGANLTTLAVYAALGGAMFLLVLRLQDELGYSALEAGTSLLPVTVIMIALSPRTSQFAMRFGPRIPMTAGPLVAGAGMWLFGLVRPGSHYATTVLPAAIVFGLGLSVTVPPLTAAVLAAVDDGHLGVGSAANNAVARLAGLLAVAVLPAVASDFATAMRICAAVCACGGAIAWVTVRRAVMVRAMPQAGLHHACHHPDIAA